MCALLIPVCPYALGFLSGRASIHKLHHMRKKWVGHALTGRGGGGEGEREGVKMAPPIITCPRREWGVSGWFISEYIIRFRFYVDDRRPFVRPDCDGQMTMAAKCCHAAKYARGSGIRNGRGARDFDLIDERARRRPGFDRLDIYSSRDHPFSSQEGEGGGGGGDTSLLLRFFVTWFARRKSLRNGNG